MSNSPASFRFSVAPMLDLTDRHCRFMHRQFSQHALLYSEMITCGAILHGDTHMHLQHQNDGPVALQLGGSDAKQLQQAIQIANDYQYDEYNLNVGCPSDRVQNGMFGACLMAQPELVADCLNAMQEVANAPVTIKHRIGINEHDDYDYLFHFVKTVSERSSIKQFIVHARVAILAGLSPKQNREIPPLQYEHVYRLKQDFADLDIIINGGIDSIEQCQSHLQHIDGVMLGRKAYKSPRILQDVDNSIFNDTEAKVKSEDEVFVAMLSYCREQLDAGTPFSILIKHLLHLFQGRSGARQYRQHISENFHKQTSDKASLQLLCDAYNKLKDKPLNICEKLAEGV